MISILYVDDEFVLLEIAKRHLENMGTFTVDTADSAERALKKIAEKPYDAIISDYQMPEMDGIGFLKVLRASGNSTPFIIFTGKGREEVVIQAFESGADFYIQKGGDPKVQFAELAHKVNQAVEFRKAESARRESEQKLQDIINFLPDATFAVDMRGRVIAWNRAIEEMTGVPATDMLGKNDYEHALPFYGDRRPILIDLALQDSDEVKSRYSYIRWEGDRLVAETTGARLKGEDVVLWGTATSLYDSEGRLAGAIESIRDITHQRRSEEALSVAREKYAKAFLAAPDAITISELDSGRFIEVNDAATAIYGYSREEMIGGNATELGIWRNKADRQALVDRVLAQGRVSRYEIIERRKSGEEFLASVNADTMSIDGIRYLIAIVRDISAQRKMTEAIKESGEKFRTLLENMPDLIIVHREGKILYVNPAMTQTMGFTPEEVQNKPIRDYIAPEYQELVVASIKKRKDLQSLHPYEIEICAKNGTRRSVIVRGEVIEFGGLPAILNVLTDITDRRRADQELRDSEKRYSALFDHNYSVSLLIDPDSGRIVDANAAACDYYGFSREQLAEMGIYDLNRLPREKVISDLIRAKNKKERHFFSTHYLAGGEKRNVEVYSGPITVQGRALFYSIIHDITERKRMEQSLRESEQRYHNIIEDQTEFICRFLPDGTHVFVNEAYCRNFNKSREEIIGHVFVPEIPEEDRNIVERHFQSLTPENPVAIDAHRIILPDGSVHWQRWSDRAIFDENGKIVEYQSVGRDITEQKEAEAALRDSEQLRMEIINHLPDPTFAINERGEVIAWNKAIEEFLGIKAATMIGKGNYEYAIPFYGERRPILMDLAILPDEHFLREKYGGISRLGETLVAETTIAHPQGRTAILWAKASPLYDKSGSVIGAIETIRDITDRKHEETKLRHVNTQLNLLSSITRHDILNQLMVLKGYLELSQDTLEDPKTVAGFLRRGKDAALAIEDLILFTRQYHDLGVKEPEWQDVGTTIARAKTNLPLGRIEVRTSGSRYEVCADPLFDRVFYNLIDNALKYGGSGMTGIRFFLQESDTGLTIVCEDDGAGVPEGKKTAIFNREFYKHTGFGLYLSREILGITGITIVENGEPGKGARFYINVPKVMYRSIEQKPEQVPEQS